MGLNRQVSDRSFARLVSGMVGYALGVRVESILSEGRGTLDVARARQVSMYLAHVAVGMSLARVAQAFDRDRSTVAHACQIIEDRRDDPAFEAWIETLEDGVRTLQPLGQHAA